MLMSNHKFVHLLGKRLHPVDRDKLSACSKAMKYFIFNLPTKLEARFRWVNLNPEIMLTIAKFLRPRHMVTLACVNKQTRKSIDCDDYWAGPAIHSLISRLKPEWNIGDAQFPFINDIFMMVNLSCSYHDAINSVVARARHFYAQDADPEIKSAQSLSVIELARFTKRLYLKNASDDSMMKRTAAPTVKAILQNYLAGDGNRYGSESLEEYDPNATFIFHYTAYWLRAYYNDDNFDYKTRNYFISEFCRMLIAEDKKISHHLKESVNHVDLVLSDQLSRRFWARIKALFMEYDGDERTAIYFLKKFRDIYDAVIGRDNHVKFPFLTISSELKKHQYRLESTDAPRHGDAAVIVIDDTAVIVIDDEEA